MCMHCEHRFVLAEMPQKPLLHESFNTDEPCVVLVQIHMFLFYIALSHVICGYLMIRISSARVDIWRQWLLDDDAHSKA